jgi:hypothetical protein
VTSVHEEMAESASGSGRNVVIDHEVSGSGHNSDEGEVDRGSDRGADAAADDTTHTCCFGTSTVMINHIREMVAFKYFLKEIAAHSHMSPLDYVTVVNCLDSDVNDAAFVRVTRKIGWHDAVEVFLACRIYPLSANFGFGEVVEALDSGLEGVGAFARL